MAAGGVEEGVGAAVAVPQAAPALGLGEIVGVKGAEGVGVCPAAKEGLLESVAAALKDGVVSSELDTAGEVLALGEGVVEVESAGEGEVVVEPSLAAVAVAARGGEGVAVAWSGVAVGKRWVGVGVAAALTLPLAEGEAAGVGDCEAYVGERESKGLAEALPPVPLGEGDSLGEEVRDWEVEGDGDWEEEGRGVRLAFRTEMVPRAVSVAPAPDMEGEPEGSGVREVEGDSEGPRDSEGEGVSDMLGAALLDTEAEAVTRSAVTEMLGVQLGEADALAAAEKSAVTVVDALADAEAVGGVEALGDGEGQGEEVLDLSELLLLLPEAVAEPQPDTDTLPLALRETEALPVTRWGEADGLLLLLPSAPAEGVGAAAVGVAEGVSDAAAAVPVARRDAD